MSLRFQAYQMRDAGACIHSHGMESCLVTMINPLAKEFRVSTVLKLKMCISSVSRIYLSSLDL